jgi:hypothetical protein
MLRLCFLLLLFLVGLLLALHFPLLLLLSVLLLLLNSLLLLLIHFLLLLDLFLLLLLDVFFAPHLSGRFRFFDRFVCARDGLRLSAWPRILQRLADSPDDSFFPAGWGS